MRYYTASKSRTQGRDAWTAIFRHPLRFDSGTGRSGRRVRRGLGTTDELEADRLVEQLNELLRTEAYWERSARAHALEMFDPRVVDIFFDGIEATEPDFAAVRDAILPMPGTADGYRTVMLLGTTGAGKTTVVRQLLGTDPATERFPSTSTAKTTVADTELVLRAEGPYRAAVTFVGRDEVIDYLTENVSEAALAAYRGKGDAELMRRLLDHVNQRLRFSYILGRPDDNEDDLDDDEDDDGPDIDVADFGDIDLPATAAVLRGAVASIRSVVVAHADLVRVMAKSDETDERVVEEYIEENLDSELRQSEEFHSVVDNLVDEIEKRFLLLSAGELRRNRQGWPESWHYESDDREGFIRTVMRFSSNYAPLFGRLLTPLVNGIRVEGPFRPGWADEAPSLVLVDGEGLGHTPNSAASLSTGVSRRLEEVDAVLLVDNATQPMQAAPVAALKSIAASGNGSKLFILFTHLDQVKGDNLPTFGAREEHVLASVDNVLKAIGDELGPFAERSLRQRVETARFFVGGIQEQLSGTKKAVTRSVDQLRALTDALAGEAEEIDLGSVRPVYDRVNLSLAVAEAARGFHSKWRGLLGLEFNANAPKEHWSRVKALSRRLAEGWDDEYADLKPVADLRYELQMQIYLMLQRPLRWEGGEPDDDGKQHIIDAIANSLTNRLSTLTGERIKDDVRLAWQDAYGQRGPGSTYIRARIIAADVYERGAPVPTVVASPDQNKFLRSVAHAFNSVAEELNVALE